MNCLWTVSDDFEKIAVLYLNIIYVFNRMKLMINNIMWTEYKVGMTYYNSIHTHGDCIGNIKRT